MNYLLPERDVFPMHCSANMGADGKTALFFGLSGTGKTTLSADPHRRLIGDDEHGWGERGVFNFEGGCYAKCVDLSEEKEPQIYHAIRFGAVLENVVIDPRTGEPDYEDIRYTENTRAAYPVEFIENAVVPGIGGQPANVLFLAADAFGVLPPIAKLTPEQAMYHFLSGYTAKLAGTEAGLGSEPVPEFSTCFASPFIPLAPKVYAAMLGERLRQYGAQCWLVNTGWTGGVFGVGKRMSLPHTRALVTAALDGSLTGAEFTTEPAFGLSIPTSCPGVPAELLNPRNAWPDKAAYDRQAAALAAQFEGTLRASMRRLQYAQPVRGRGGSLGVRTQASSDRVCARRRRRQSLVRWPGSTTSPCATSPTAPSSMTRCPSATGAWRWDCGCRSTRSSRRWRTGSARRDISAKGIVWWFTRSIKNLNKES